MPLVDGQKIDYGKPPSQLPSMYPLLRVTLTLSPIGLIWDRMRQPVLPATERRRCACSAFLSAIFWCLRDVRSLHDRPFRRHATYPIQASTGTTGVGALVR